METWFNRMPKAARMAFTGVLAFGAVFGVMQLQALDDHSGSFQASVLIFRLVAAAVVGLMAGVLGVVFGDQRIRRVFGSTEQAIGYRRALRTGQLPAHIEPAVWRGWLNSSGQSLRWTPVAIAIFGVVGVVDTLTHRWATAALFAVFVIWFAVMWWVQRGRTSRLAAAVEQRAAEAQVD